MTHIPYLFNQTTEQMRRIGARGGKTQARNRWARQRAAGAAPRETQFVIELQTIVDQPAGVFRSQNRRGLGKAAPRQNLAVGYLFGDHRPEPAELRFHLPAGLVHMGQLASPRGFPQRMPSGLRLTRHALDGAAYPTPTHLQMKPLFQNGRHIGVGQTLRFVHQQSQGQGFRPHLYRCRPEGIGGLQWMASLHALAALYTAADRNIKPPDPGAAHDFFLILCFDPLYHQRSAALWAFLGHGHGDGFVNMIRDRPAVVFAVRFAGLAARGFGRTPTLPSRKRSRLAPGGPLRRFQLLLQARNLFPQPRILVLQTVLLPRCLIQIFAGLAQLPHQLFDAGNWVQRLEIEKQMTI